MLKFLRRIMFVMCCITVFSYCSQDYLPKPRGYFRIDLPKHDYKTHQSPCEYVFDYPDFGVVVSDPMKGTDPCWFNINMPTYKAQIHLTYVDVSVDSVFASCLQDAHTLAYKHTIKADAIDEKLMTDKTNKVYGILYDIRGNAASSIQFFVTDSVRHFLRGALYFNVEPNKDSLAPVIDFLKKDLVHLMESVRWKKSK